MMAAFFLQSNMDQFFYPSLTAFFAALITWFFNRKSSAINNEIKSADFYRSLLDDAEARLNRAINAIEERDKRIEERDEKIKERDKKIDLLIFQIEHLTDELKKYKQLNGKTE